MAEALLIVDYQNDFTPPDGALAVPEGDRISEKLNELAASDRFDFVVATRDWHPPDHQSFEQHGGPWPEHCVRGTEGAELDPSLERSNIDLVLDKGQDRDTEGYSAFEQPELHQLLSERDIDSITVGGLATDICVRASSLDAIEHGYDVELVSDATRGVDDEVVNKTLREIEERGGRVV